MLESILAIVEKSIDAVMAAIPRRRPSTKKYQELRWVSHRGEHLPYTHPENTLAAFAKAQELGAWGIEFDVQWTKDDVPVICHDEDLNRVFAKDINVTEMSFADLRAQEPQVPKLAEILDQFAGKMHLMIEIKDADISDERIKTLESLLENLEPLRDFHFLLLNPEMHEMIPWAPKSAIMLVSIINTAEIAQACLEGNFGAISGHYLLISGKIRRQLRKKGYGIGVGFVASRSVLRQQINDDVDWIFTNHATRLQKIIAAESS